MIAHAKLDVGNFRRFGIEWNRSEHGELCYVSITLYLWVWVWTR